MPRDNLIVAIDPVEPGRRRAGRHGHGAHHARAQDGGCSAIAKGQPILKFGQIIGFATEDIAPGAHVHTHNCSFAEFERDYAFAQDAREEPLLPPEARATFEGFRRGNGKAGTRNYIGILTSVNCSASVARFMAEAVSRSGILAAISRTSTASSRSSTAPAAAWPARARATRRWSARNGATPATPTSPRRWWSGWAARCSRSRA